MKIDTTREGGSAALSLAGRLDREWAEHLSDTLEGLLQDGVRSLTIDFAEVTYVSSAATSVLTRWRQELSLLRGAVTLSSLSPAAREVFAAAGWEVGLDAGSGRSSSGDLRRSTWHVRGDFETSGIYELSSCTSPGTLTCRLIGKPDQISLKHYRPDDCTVVDFRSDVTGLGVGAIGQNYDESHCRLGELVAMAGTVAYFPTDGARMADYFVGGPRITPRAVLASGLICEGGFSQLMRFSTQPESDGIPLSELAGVALDAAGGRIAGLAIAGETSGIAGTRLRRSPANRLVPLSYDIPEVREWLSFAPERVHPMTTTLIAGVVAKGPAGPLATHLRPLGPAGLFGHLHAAVFSYYPLPQRTVELPTLVQGLFAGAQLRDVLHLLWDDRNQGGVGESALVRGVGWVAPVTQVG